MGRLLQKNYTTIISQIEVICNALLYDYLDLNKYFGRDDRLNRKTTEQTDKIKPIERKITIGNMTYIVVSHFSKTSTDTAEDKIERLIKRDIKG